MGIVLDTKIVVALLVAGFAAIVILFMPVPYQEIVTYRDNVSYEAVVVTTNVGRTEQTCITSLVPLEERRCGAENLSYSASSVECSNLSVSRAVYRVHNLNEQKGRFSVTLGFNLENGVVRDKNYDTVINGKSSETFSFSLNTTRILGCFLNVERAQTEITCKNDVKYSVDTTCYGGEGIPVLSEDNQIKYKEVERQRIETKYTMLICQVILTSACSK